MVDRNLRLVPVRGTDSYELEFFDMFKHMFDDMPEYEALAVPISFTPANELIGKAFARMLALEYIKFIDLAYSQPRGDILRVYMLTEAGRKRRDELRETHGLLNKS